MSVCSLLSRTDSLQALPARNKKHASSLRSARSSQGCAAAAGDLPSYYSHLKKRTYDPEERDARKKQRNDLKEAARLAQLSKPGSS
jgi:hypothetical protein